MNKKILLSLTLLVGFSAQICAFEVTSALKTTGDLLAQPGASLADAGVYITAATLGMAFVQKFIDKKKAFKPVTPYESGLLGFLISTVHCGVIYTTGYSLAIHGAGPLLGAFTGELKKNQGLLQGMIYGALPALCGLVGLTIKNGFMRYITKK